MLFRLLTPRLYSYNVVFVALLFTLIFFKINETVPLTFNLLMLISAEVSVLFGAVELGLADTGKYESNMTIFNALNRSVSAFGLAFIFMLLIGAHEILKG